MTFGVSSQSVNSQIGTPMDGSYITITGYYGSTKTGPYFAHGTEGLAGSQHTTSSLTCPSLLGVSEKKLDSYNKYQHSFRADCLYLNQPKSDARLDHLAGQTRWRGAEGLQPAGRERRRERS